MLARKGLGKKNGRRWGVLIGLPSDWDRRELEGSLTSSEGKQFIFVIIYLQKTVSESNWKEER